MAFRQTLLSLGGALALGLIVSSPVAASDLGYVEPSRSGWEFSFTPYGWMINVNGDVTARGHTADINENFFQIVEKSDSLLAWMSYFEARKGRFALFTDLVWMDLGFPGRFQINKSSLGRFDRATLDVVGKAQLDYQSLIIQSGAAYELVRWDRGPGSFTAFDVLGSARYWNQDVDVSLRLTGTFTVDLERLGLKFKRAGWRLPAPTTSNGSIRWSARASGISWPQARSSGSKATWAGSAPAASFPGNSSATMDLT